MFENVNISLALGY